MTPERWLHSLVRQDRACSRHPDGYLDFINDPAADESAVLTPETLEDRRKYQTEEAAQHYNHRYARKKRSMTRRESAVVQKLLARCAPSATVLDLPCGGGRLSPAIGRFAQTLIEMDLSPGQLLYGLRYGRSNVPQIWVRGSALDVPLKDRSVDVSVCVRLSHHLYLREERERLLAELLRVTRQFAIFYFVDGDALRNRLRRWRNRHNSTVRKVNWMTRSELNALLPQLGGRMVACSSAGWFGPHRYALIQKTANVAREARESF